MQLIRYVRFLENKNKEKKSASNRVHDFRKHVIKPGAKEIENVKCEICELCEMRNVK